MNLLFFKKYSFLALGAFFAAPCLAEEIDYIKTYFSPQSRIRQHYEKMNSTEIKEMIDAYQKINDALKNIHQHAQSNNALEASRCVQSMHIPTADILVVLLEAGTDLLSQDRICDEETSHVCAAVNGIWNNATGNNLVAV